MSTSALFGDEQRQTSPLQLVVEGSQGPYTVLHVGGDVDLYTAARLGAALVLLAGAGKHVDSGGTKVLAVRLSPAGEVEAWARVRTPVRAGDVIQNGAATGRLRRLRRSPRGAQDPGRPSPVGEKAGAVGAALLAAQRTGCAGGPFVGPPAPFIGPRPACSRGSPRWGCRGLWAGHNPCLPRNRVPGKGSRCCPPSRRGSLPCRP